MLARPLVLTLLLLSTPLRAGENVWTPVGPEGGAVTDLAFSINGRTVYAGTPATGVFKSVNTGRTWSLTDPSLRGAVRDVETDPFRPGTVYAATSQGVWKSDDAGATWRDLTRLPETTADVRVVAADPLSPGVVYLGVVGGRVFRSVDGGASWQLANAGLPEDASGVRAIAVHPRRRGVLFAATLSGIFRSNNSGRTWRRSGLRGSDVIDVKIDPVQPSRLYAVRIVTVEEESPPTHPEILVSEDEGGSWRLSTAEVGGLHTGRLAVEPSAPGTAYFFSVFSGLYKTTDGGGHWTPVLVLDSGGQAYSGFQAMAFHPRQPGLSLLSSPGDGDRAILRTADGGVTWSRSGAGLRAQGVMQVVADPWTPGVVYTLSELALWKTGDAGRTWRRLEVPAGGSLLQLVLDPRTPSTLYLAAAGSAYKSVDGGETWRRLDEASPLRVLAVDPADPSTLYGADFTTLFKSTDAGEHWMDLPATRGFQSTVLTLDPNRPSTIYADFRHLERGGVSRSTDGGATWSTVLEIQSAPLAPRLTFSDVAVQPGSSERVLAAFFRSGFDFVPTRGGVYRTADGGATWSLSRLEARNPPPPALALLFDPRRPSRVYAGSTAGRAYVSADAGVTWSFLGQGLPSASVLDLEIDPFDPDTIYAATHGGLYSLTYHPRR